MLWGGFNDNFRFHVYPLKTYSVRLACEVLKKHLTFHYNYAQG